MSLKAQEIMNHFNRIRPHMNDELLECFTDFAEALEMASEQVNSDFDVEEGTRAIRPEDLDYLVKTSGKPTKKSPNKRFIGVHVYNCPNCKRSTTSSIKGQECERCLEKFTK